MLWHYHTSSSAISLVVMIQNFSNRGTWIFEFLLAFNDHELLTESLVNITHKSHMVYQGAWMTMLVKFTLMECFQTQTSVKIIQNRSFFVYSTQFLYFDRFSKALSFSIRHMNGVKNRHWLFRLFLWIAINLFWHWPWMS